MYTLEGVMLEGLYVVMAKFISTENYRDSASDLLACVIDILIASSGLLLLFYVLT